MKKMKILALAACFASVSSLMGSDLYITGSTAFRANVFSACQKIFDSSSPKIVFGPTSTGGDGTATSGNPQWTMIGTVTNLLSGVVSGPFTIHAYFTGSIQGTKGVEQLTPLVFVDANTNGLTNTATIAFSDSSSTVSPYPATGSFSEEKVAVQPFVFVKSSPTSDGTAGGTPFGAVTNINNITWEQLKYIISAGNAPLSFWTGKSSDSSLVYFIQRTKDSGSRMSTLREAGYTYNQGVTTYIFSFTNGFWYKAANNNTTFGTVGESNATFVVGIVGTGAAAAANAANLGWGPGYIGGGDIKAELAYHTNANQAISYLSISDAKSILSGNPNNWSQVISFGGAWPTAAGSGIHGQIVTNDYTPVIWGNYPFWNYEVVIYPNVDPSSLSSDQNLTAAQLGNQSTPGTILGVLDHQTTGTPTLGSIENEIELSKTNLATAIRLSDMNASRSTVGGVITP
jgi:hypothetical protein